MILGAKPSFDIYSSHGHLMDRKDSIDDAYRCLREWPAALFVITAGRCVLHRDDVEDWETERRQGRVRIGC